MAKYIQVYCVGNGNYGASVEDLDGLEALQNAVTHKQDESRALITITYGTDEKGRSHAIICDDEGLLKPKAHDPDLRCKFLGHIMVGHILVGNPKTDDEGNALDIDPSIKPEEILDMIKTDFGLGEQLAYFDMLDRIGNYE